MGNYRIEIDAVGAHGCDRSAFAPSGPLKPIMVHPEGYFCPDCEVRTLVDKMRNASQFSNGGSAVLRHWPGSEGEVVDDLVAGVRRSGSFGH